MRKQTFSTCFNDRNPNAVVWTCYILHVHMWYMQSNGVWREKYRMWSPVVKGKCLYQRHTRRYSRCSLFPSLSPTLLSISLLSLHCRANSLLWLFFFFFLLLLLLHFALPFSLSLSLTSADPFLKNTRSRENKVHLLHRKRSMEFCGL